MDGLDRGHRLLDTAPGRSSLETKAGRALRSTYRLHDKRNSHEPTANQARPEAPTPAAEQRQGSLVLRR